MRTQRFNIEPKVAIPWIASIALGGLSIYQRYKRREAEHEATHDKLTGLLNERGLNKLLGENKPPRALLYVDGTNQKAINDNIGHARGDEAIVGTAKVLAESLRPGDVAARVGGDEFLVLLDTKRRTSPEPLSPDELLTPVTARIYDKTQTFLDANPDLKAEGFDIAVGGIVWQDGMSAKDAQLGAESAMYVNKDLQHQTNGQHR